MSVLSFDALPTVLQASVIVSTITAGLLATPHCLSMCGPLAIAVGTSRRRAWLQQMGRGVGYVTLGTIAGGLGPDWLQHGPSRTWTLAALLVLAFIVLKSAWNLARTGGLHAPRSAHANASDSSLFHSLLRRWSHGSTRVWRAILEASRTSPNLGAFLAGLASFLLPCGQLYIFSTAALATGRAEAGAGILALFWLGTLPSFILGPALIRRWLSPWSKRAPKAAAALLLIAGFSSLALFARHLDHSLDHAPRDPSSPQSHSPRTSDSRPETQPHCH
ncbi:MAG: sulfite exporter TauE/SafE family protein [Bdellovibrionaceae bacterium]|nr:sulfite exporter TauE/SafE family protein [Pseudobdellovibrionaceae bacterium]